MPIGFEEIQVDPTPVGTVVTLKFREGGQSFFCNIMICNRKEINHD